jgi:Ran GTPase-activating protein (RanGAP) involved in mRNA processing and transport
MKALRVLKFDDMFTRRKNPEIHPALRAFSTALLSQSLVYLDLR